MSNKIRTFALVRGMFNASRCRGKDRIMLGRMTYIIRLRVLACASLLCSLLCDAQSVLTLRVGNALPNVLDGMGVELDPHFLPQNVTANNGTRAEDWDSVVLRRLRLLRPALLFQTVLDEVAAEHIDHSKYRHAHDHARQSEDAGEDSDGDEDPEAGQTHAVAQDPRPEDVTVELLQQKNESVS